MTPTEPPVDLEELVVHLFFALDQPGPQACYEHVRSLWDSWTPRFGRPVVGSGLPPDPPSTLPGLPTAVTPEITLAARESDGGDRQLVLRRRHDVLNVSVSFGGHTYDGDQSGAGRRPVIPPPRWADFDREWEEMSRDVGALLGEARLYLATTPQLPGTGAAAALTAAAGRRLPAGPRGPSWEHTGAVTDEGLAVWEVSPRGGPEVARRILVIAPGGDDDAVGLSAWTWSNGGTAMPPFARYLLHAAKLRRLAAEAGSDGTGALSEAVREVVGQLRRPGPYDGPDRRALAFELLAAQDRLTGRRDDAEAIATNLDRTRPGGPAAGLFAEARAEAAGLAERLDDEIRRVQADRDLLREAGALDERHRGAKDRSAVQPAQPEARVATPADTLDDYFDPAVAPALRAWAAGHGGEVVLPTRELRWDSPHTGAVLAAVRLRRPNPTGGFSGRLVIVKVCPADPMYAQEAGAVSQARARSPEFAAKYIVGQPYDPYPVPDGRQLLFFDFAGSRRDTVPLAYVPAPDLATVCRAVVELVLTEWNNLESADLATTTAAEYLRLELRGSLDDGTGRAWASADETGWTSVDDTGPVPDPVRMARPDSAAEKVSVDYRAGFSHGDLHLGNVMVRLRPGTAPSITFIDLSAYEAHAPLTRDLVTLLLALVESTVRNPLSDEDAGELIELVLDPRAAPTQRFAPVVVDPIRAGYDIVDRVPTGADLDWHLQYLLSLQAQALVHLTYDDLGPDGHWWFFRLAARAARRFNDELGEKDRMPEPQAVHRHPRSPGQER